MADTQKERVAAPLVDVASVVGGATAVTLAALAVIPSLPGALAVGAIGGTAVGVRKLWQRRQSSHEEVDVVASDSDLSVP